MTLPTWRSLFDWPADDGHVGWSAGAVGDVPDDSYAVAHALDERPGLWLWPVGGREYATGGAQWSLRAPGTTRIARASLVVSYTAKLLAHHCARIGLRDGDEERIVRTLCKPATPASAATRDRLEIDLVDSSKGPMSKEVFAEISVPACAKARARSCAKWIPAHDQADNGRFLRVVSADLTLVDDEGPGVRPSRAFFALDGRYIDGREVYPLRIDVEDAGSGVTGIDVDHRGWPDGVHPPLAGHRSSCDAHHHTPALGSRVCPRSDHIDLEVDTRPMPEGTRRFRASSSDVAGNSDEVPWTVIIDRTAPSAPQEPTFTMPEEGSGQAVWRAADDPRLPDGTAGSDVGGYRERHRVADGPWSAWRRLADEARAGDELYDHPAGTQLEFQVTAIDRVGNESPVVHAAGAVHGAPPSATTSGRLSSARGGYIGRERAVVTIAASDDGVGVRRIWLAREGVGEVAHAEADCLPRTDSVGHRWKASCPSEASREFTVQTGDLPEGRVAFAARAEDRVHNVTDGDRWDVLVDHTPPPTPADVVLEDYDDETDRATVAWTVEDDPSLPGNEPGSGVARSEVRHRVTGGEWSGWESVDEGRIDIASVPAGVQFDVEVRTLDRVGNVSGIATGTLRPVIEDADALDFPVGDPEGADAAVEVVLQTVTGELMPIGGLPVTIWDAAGRHKSVLTADDGVAYFRDLQTGEHRVHVAQAGGVSAVTDDVLWFSTGEVSRHRIQLRIGGEARASAARARLRARAAQQSPSGVSDFLYCVKNIPLKVCKQFLGDALRAEFVAKVLFAAVPDRTRANAFKHSYAVARFTRTMLTKFGGEPIQWGYDFARGHELQDREDPDVDIRRASFMDTNNNLVGYNYTRDHPTRNVTQLCSTMRTKSRNALYARYAAGEDEISVPPNHLRTRLIFNRPYDPGVIGSGHASDAEFFPDFKPCKYALSRYEGIL